MYAFSVILRNLLKRRFDTLFGLSIQLRAIACGHLPWFFLPVLFILLFATRLPLVGQSDSTTYLFDHSLDAEEAGVVPLTAIDPLGQNAFVSSNVFGMAQTVYRFDGNLPGVEQAGLQLDTTDLLTTKDEYSVEMVFRFTEKGVGGWRRVLDARNRHSDQGLYLDFQGRFIVPIGLEIWSQPSTEGVFHHVVLTVSGGEVNLYLDGSHGFTETTDVMDITTDNLLTFFADNHLGDDGESREVADGEVARIRVYDRLLTGGDVEELATAMGLLDADGDGFHFPEDEFLRDPTEWKDTDGDGTGNNADKDDDGDGIPDGADSLPLVVNPGVGLPPDQDYYLHFSQFRVTGEAAWAPTPGELVVSDTLTVEAWVLWEGSDFEEFQAATGIDRDQMSLFCGQRAYGFQYRFDGAEGWTFFLQTDEEVVRNTGQIPLPLGEWSHLAATYDGGVIRTFLNGVQQTATAVSGSIPSLGDAFPEQCNFNGRFGDGFASEVFGIGLGDEGFQGGIRQARVWNRALTRAEIVANAGIHLNGTESGLVGYWPLGGPSDAAQAESEVAGGPPLQFGDPDEPLFRKPVWHLTDPLFVIREDLAEDAVVTDCPSLPFFLTWWLVDVQNDGDLDLIFSGSNGDSCDIPLTPFWALIHEGERGFVFDTASAIAGTVPLAHNSIRKVIEADFNGDGRLDVFSANTGDDFCDDFGATNTLLLSRPDGRLEDASGNLLGAPCDTETRQFDGQNMCYSDWVQRVGGTVPKRYPGPGDLAPLAVDWTHGAAAGDIDGDGDVDIMTANIPTSDVLASYVLLNDGFGKFEANWELLPDYMYLEDVCRIDPLGSLLADMDGDGHVDLVTPPGLGSVGTQDEAWIGGISWNDGTGDFSVAERMPIVPTVGIPGSGGRPYPHSSGAMVASDIDNDGDSDLLVVWDNTALGIPDDRSSLQILVNQGDRVFTDETVARAGAPPQVGMPNGVLIFHAVDINNDGCPDILFPEDWFSIFEPKIWLNDCNGYFTPVTEPVLTKAGGIYIPLDVDGDGDTDLLNARGRHTFTSGTEGCSPGEGRGSDQIDFAVFLNTSPSSDEPVIGTVNATIRLSGGTMAATLYAEDLTATNNLASVFAMVTPPTAPGVSPPLPLTTVELNDVGGGRYEAVYGQFGPTAGTYQVAIFAEDYQGEFSDGAETQVVQEEGPDRFEPDDSAIDPPAIVVDGVAAQYHTIHEAADTDWVLFYAESGQSYEITAEDVGVSADIVLEVFEPDGLTQATDGGGDPFKADDGGAGQSELLLFTPTTDGIYFVKVSDRDSNTGGAGTGYDLRVDRPGTDEEADPFGGSDIAGFPGWKASPWYSNSNVQFWPWIFHGEHGWQFVWEGSTAEAVFLFDLGLNEWLFFSENTYRSMFLFGDSPGWIFTFADNTPDRRFFSRLEDGSLFGVPAELTAD